MRISDWSSDVCSSVYLIELSVARLAVDAPQLRAADVRQTGAESVAQEPEQAENCVGIGSGVGHNLQRIELGFLLQQESQDEQTEIGRASGRERVCQYVKMSVVGG